ncbi:MAG: peptidylprolyl isomerase [Bacteroidota bacterium]
MVTLWVSGCGSANPTVATIGDEVLTQRDFEESYAKNNGGWETGAKASLEERQRFLDLLVKFRLKVKEAKRRKLDQDSTVRSELEGYEQSLAQTYMVDKEIVEPAVRALYERKKDLVRASHILIRLPEHATPDDTLKAWNRTKELIAQSATKNFDTLAVAHSEDQSVSFNRGDLGFFGPGRMVAPFEDACYPLSPGQVTASPVRTQFGYHVIKVTARQPNRGAVQLSHILLRSQAPTDTAWIRDTTQTILSRLAAGTPFETLVAEYSMDPGSMSRGGDIGAYERDRLPADLAELLYATPKGSVARPYFAPYGAHVFRVNGFDGLPSFADAERDLKQQYQQLRYANDFENFIHGLKKRYDLTLAVPVVLRLQAALDTTKSPADTLWSDLEDAGLAREVLFTVAGRTITVDTVVGRISGAAEFRTFRLTPPNVDHILERIGETLVLQEHAMRAVERHPVFAELMKEYRDGILLYRIEQDEVWQKVVVNDTLLRVYYEEHKERYRWPDRVNFAEIYVTTDSLAQAAQRRLTKGEGFVDVAEDMTMRAGYREKRGTWGFQSGGFNNLATQAMGMAVDSVTGPFRNGPGFSIIRVLGKEAPRVKTFEEAGPEIIGAYQEEASKERERVWVSSLRTQYGVTIDAEALRTAFQRPREDPR